MPTEPAFRLNENFSGLFTTASLDDLLGRLATDGSVANAATGIDGELVSIDRLELVQTAAAWELRLGSVRFVADGIIHRVGPLSCQVDPSSNMFAMEWSIVRSQHEHFSERSLAAKLVASNTATSASAIPLVKLIWQENRPTLDRTWWPDVERVNADERSSLSAQTVIECLPTRHPDAVFLRLRRLTLTWNTLIAIALRHLPTTTTLEAGPSLCAFVHSLIEGLSSTYALPPTLNGRNRERFGEPTATRNEGDNTIYTFEGVTGLPARVSIGLAVQPSRETSVVEWDAIPTNGEPIRRPFDTTAAELASFDPRQPFEIRIQGGKLKSLGYYVAFR